MFSAIPIRGIPNYSFACVIPVDGANVTLLFRTTFNELAKYWLIDISTNEGVMLVSGLPVIPAQNILEQFSYMNIGSSYILPKSVVLEQWPSANTLESDWHLIWSDTHGR